METKEIKKGQIGANNQEASIGMGGIIYICVCV
jgi:hypothetical protein